MENTRQDGNNFGGAVNVAGGYSESVGNLVNGVSNNVETVTSKLGNSPIESIQGNANGIAGEINNKALPTKKGFWSKIKSVLFYEINVELTPHQQKIEKEINDFLYQEVTWKKVKNFLFKEIKF